MFNPLTILDNEQTVSSQVVNDLCSNCYNCYYLPILWSDGTITSLYDLISNNGLPDGYPIGINIYDNKFIGLSLLYEHNYYGVRALRTTTDGSTKRQMKFFTGGQKNTEFGVMSLTYNCRTQLALCRDEFGTCIKFHGQNEFNDINNQTLTMIRQALSASTTGVITLNKEIGESVDMNDEFYLTETLDFFDSHKNLFAGKSSTQFINSVVNTFNRDRSELTSELISIPVYLCSLYNECFTKPGDWYLPSIGELLQVYAIINQIIAVQNTLLELNSDYKMYMFNERTWFWSSSIVNTEGLPAPISINSNNKEACHIYVLNTLVNSIRVVEPDTIKLTVLPIIDLDKC